VAGNRTPVKKAAGAITIRRKLGWLAFVGICGLLIFASISFIALRHIEVNGPLYQGIRLSDSLVADYAPPSESLLGTALLCAQLADAPDRRSRHLYEEALKTSEHDYDATYADYMSRIPEGKLKTMMRGEAYETAQEYFQLAGQLVVLVDSNRGEEARRLLVSTMNPVYDRHAVAVGQIVLLATQEARINEALASRSVQIYTITMTAIGLYILFVVSTLSVVIARGISVQADRLVQTDELLRDNEELYRSTFDQASVGIIHTSFEGKILRANPRFAEILGFPLDEVVGKNFQQFTPPEYLAESMAAFQLLITGVSGTAGLEKPYLRKDGQLAWVNLTSSVQRDGNGKPLHLMAFMEDISARKEAEAYLAAKTQELILNEARYRTVFQTSKDALSITRLSDGMNIEFNQAMLELLGFESGELIGSSSLELGVWVNPKERENLVEILRQNSSIRDEKTQFRRKSGEEFWVLLSASLIHIDGIDCIFTVARDLSDARAAEDEIRNLAFYDRTTLLPNRRLLVDRLYQILSGDLRGHKGAVIFVNLDDFKTTNDTLGHQIGDLLLREVAERLTACVGEVQTVARFGADEFVVMLEGLSESSEQAANQARIVADMILAAIREPYRLDGHERQSTPSIGITVFGEKRESPNDVLQQAGIAMRQAKTAGGNTMRFFAPALQAAVNARAAMKDDLSHAAGENQFLLYYQPQVDSKGLIGAEALIRWNHPVRGLVPPNEFIPLAEETGLILALGDLVLETACKQIAAWADQKVSADLQIAVNISARQFSQPNFVESVLATLTHTGANPKKLKLELTESMLAHDIDDVIAKMTTLKSHGLSFALDDFGTGYSSLSYLRHLPLDQLKIDRAFVSDILTDVASAAIAQTVVSLGRAMGLSVIAEGVETKEQHKFLAALGADSFQGYLFSRPLPLEEFETHWINK
jgi:diguanylate cyclase (GGDEF)-like protein/PAS domain S-box-containing protein